MVRALAVSVLAALGSLFLCGCSSTPKQEAEQVPAKQGDIKESYQTFKDALTRDDYDAAYESLSRDTRDRYPSQVFWIAFNMTSTGQRYRSLLANSVLVTAIEKSDGVSAVAVLRATDPAGGRAELKSFRMVKEEGKWLVQFTLQEFFGIPEESFFDLGAVTEKRDFRQRR